jgi:hypothetical protein
MDRQTDRSAERQIITDGRADGQTDRRTGVRAGGRLARPGTQHDCHHDTKVKPEAASAVIELLMMGGKLPKHVEI